MVQRVAVIGAGAAGLVALRHLVAKPSVFQAVAFEQAASIGGTWVYTENIGKDDEGLPIHSSMYTNLRTNLPKECMAFPDLQFATSPSSYISHGDVKHYLEYYADKFSLKKYIKMHSIIDSVTPRTTSNGTVWDVMVSSVKDKQLQPKHWTFDAVIVCNGHYSIPLMPTFPGLTAFKGSILHSHNYRHPEAMTGQTVLCLGANSSGQDISLDLSKHAKKVYMCNRKAFLPTPLPTNVVQKCGIKEVKGSGVILSDGEEIEVDTLIFCTGYHYDFAFLNEKCRPSTHDERVYPLYKHIIHIEYPTLSFVGICKSIVPFPQFHCQVLFILAALERTMKLPNKEEMLADCRGDFDRRIAEGMPPRYAHHMSKRQWPYNDDLAKLGGFEPIPKVTEEIYVLSNNRKKADLPNYKKFSYEVTGPTSFTEKTLK